MKTLRRTTTAFGALLASAALLAACGGSDKAASEPSEDRGAAVKVATFMFEPDPLEVEAGTKVTWTNEDSTVHTVTTGSRKKPDGHLDEELAPSGGLAQTTFDKPGTYRYFCSRHSGPGMEAEVIVR